jgi:hypothetical protein
METLKIDNDIKVFYIPAKSFPNGVMEAHQKLHALIPHSTERRYFGLSRPENGAIMYKAAAEEMEPGEAEKLKCDTLTIKKGSYISIPIPDFMNDIPAIQRTFNQLLSQPGLDPQGYCVEEYINGKDMICMVRLNQ